jgi:hypothetical protein
MQKRQLGITKEKGEAISFDDEDKKFLPEWLLFVRRLRGEKAEIRSFCVPSQSLQIRKKPVQGNWV